MIHFRNCPRAGPCSCEIKCYASALGMALVIAALELAGGHLSGSFALTADALHVIIDGGAIIIAIIVAYMVRLRGASESVIRRRGTVIQALLLAVAVAGIAMEALERFGNPPEIKSVIMLAVAAAGAAGNYIQHRMIRGTEAADDRNSTRQTLSLHILSDLAQSIAVIAGGIVILLTDWRWVDPALSMLIAALMSYWIIQILRGKKPEPRRP